MRKSKNYKKIFLRYYSKPFFQYILIFYKLFIMNEKTVDKYHFNLNDLLGRGAYGSVYKA